MRMVLGTITRNALLSITSFLALSMPVASEGTSDPDYCSLVWQLLVAIAVALSCACSTLPTFLQLHSQQSSACYHRICAPRMQAVRGDVTWQEARSGSLLGCPLSLSLHATSPVHPSVQALTDLSSNLEGTGEAKSGGDEESPSMTATLWAEMSDEQRKMVEKPGRCVCTGML